MRLISTVFFTIARAVGTPRAGAFAVLPVFLLAATLAAPSIRAQAPDDDVYGVPGAPGTRPDSAPAPKADSGSAPGEAAAPAVVPPVPIATDTVKTTPRSRVTRETTINPLDSKRGSYRNPKKALFMSLMVPGLGQAYVGQTTFNYARAALYFGTEVTLGVLWYQYTVVKYDREVKRYRRYADANWSQGLYEDKVFEESGLIVPANFRAINPYRSTYCDAVTGRVTVQADSLYRWCSDPSENTFYTNFKDAYDNDKAVPSSPAEVGAIGAIREGFSDPVEFYALIGSYQEFISGWRDAANVNYSDSGITGASGSRDTYNAMRDKAQDYSRLQAWFIGGIVLNHIASAVDAALTARRNNRVLYEGEARWYDRLNVDGGLALEAGRPRTRLQASLNF